MPESCQIRLIRQNEFATRMHSSGMRTARLLTVSQHALWPWSGGVPGAVPGRGESTCPGTPPCEQND